MSREIKFRGKRIDNGEWVEGYYVKHGSRHWIYTGQIQYMYYPACADLPTKYEVDPSTVGQYIGVDDKNGNEIYEKDIVLIDGEDEYFVVEWDADTARFVMNSETLAADLDNYWGYQAEVIGNMYENADLLKEVEINE